MILRIFFCTAGWSIKLAKNWSYLKSLSVAHHFKPFLRDTRLTRLTYLALFSKYNAPGISEMKRSTFHCSTSCIFLKNGDKQKQIQRSRFAHVSFANKCHKIDTSSRVKKLKTWDRDKMCQAGPRWRLNREIAWHTEQLLHHVRYTNSKRSPSSTAINIDVN